MATYGGRLATALHPLRTILPAAVVLGACEGPQSALSPAGRDAERIASLFWWMAGGAAVIWLGVMGLALYAISAKKRTHDPRRTRLFIVGGGALVPTVVLTLLLTFGLSEMPGLLDQGESGGVRIRVSGEQWWWRVFYELPDGTRFELANEIRLPVGRRVPIELDSPDVIHSLWVPSIGGKTDLIPGRITRMALEATRTGVFRGVCAEYCGSSHAKMMLAAVVETPEAFEAWLRAQARPASAPTNDAARRGQRLFAAHGCGACHRVRGTEADGAVGPDLTHVGSRHTIGAGILGSSVADFENWLTNTEALKPEVHMPAFDMLPKGDRRALAAYLEGLK